MYEAKIGWRYLYGGKTVRPLLVLAGGSLAIALAGLVTLVAAGSNAVGLVLFVAGLLATAVFTLLSLFTVFITVSVLGVGLGVAALTVVLAVTSGFQQQFRDTVLGVN